MIFDTHARTHTEYPFAHMPKITCSREICLQMGCEYIHSLVVIGSPARLLNAPDVCRAIPLYMVCRNFVDRDEMRILPDIQYLKGARTVAKTPGKLHASIYYDSFYSAFICKYDV